MIDIAGEPRTLSETRFAASLIPCAGCDCRELGELEYRTGPGVLILSTRCPQCHTVREVRFRPSVDPVKHGTPPRYHLGGSEPSQLIRPDQFVAEIDRLTPSLSWNPEQLAPAAWRAQWSKLDRIITCFTELLKFNPDGTALIRDAPLERDRLVALADAYGREGPRIYAQEERESPKPKQRGELSSRTLEAHLQWVRRGRTGEGRLDIAHVNVKGVKVGAKDLSGARLEDVIFDRGDVSFSTFEGAELNGVSLVQAHLGDCQFNKAQLLNCDLTGANVAIGKFEDAIIVGGRFDRAFLDRCSFRRANVGGVSFRDADFGNTAFDDAVFCDCDLRGASFSLRTPRLLGTMVKTRFERCDLRDTTWEGRDIGEAVFIDCKPHGFGTP